jgi:hypothetical protein
MENVTIKHVEWSPSEDSTFIVAVTWVGGQADSDMGGNRQRYSYSFKGKGILLHSADDILSGVGEGINALKAMVTLGGFVGAWIEAMEYTDRTGRESENLYLFPRIMIGDWEDQFADFANDAILTSMAGE